MLEQRRNPSTPEQVGILFPVLTEVECRIVSDLESRFPGWSVWPHVDYPQTHIWLTRKNATAMQSLAVGMIGDLAGEIAHWISANFSIRPEF